MEVSCAWLSSSQFSQRCHHSGIGDIALNIQSFTRVTQMKPGPLCCQATAQSFTVDGPCIVSFQESGMELGLSMMHAVLKMFVKSLRTVASTLKLKQSGLYRHRPQSSHSSPFLLRMLHLSRRSLVELLPFSLS